MGFDIPVTNLPGFQFHKGTIRTASSTKDLLQLLHFNSIKVQLERMGFDIPVTNLPGFQFHKGTIRTCAYCKRSHDAGISIP